MYTNNGDNLKEKIDELKLDLIKSVKRREGLIKSKVIKQSQDLDELIVAYMKEMIS